MSKDERPLTRLQIKNLPIEVAVAALNPGIPSGKTLPRTPPLSPTGTRNPNTSSYTANESLISPTFSVDSQYNTLTPSNLETTSGNVSLSQPLIIIEEPNRVAPIRAAQPIIIPPPIIANAPAPIMAETYLKPRDVVNTVPIFSGGSPGCSFREFNTACEDARMCLPDAAQGSFTQLLKTRLSGTALQLTQGTRFNDVKSLLDHLKGIFAPRDSTLLLRGELGRVHQLYDEDVPSYLNRTRGLGNSIVDAFKSEHNNAITPDQKTELEKETAQAFILGLRAEIAAQIGDHDTLSNAGLEAIKIESRLKSQARLRLSDNPTPPSPIEAPKPRPQPNRSPPPVSPQPDRTKTCNYCKRPGHVIQECRRRQTTCNKCRKVGHFANECTFQPVHAVQINREPDSRESCQFCQQSGHTAKTCPKTKGRINNKVCQFCDKNGHLATECFKLNPDLAARAPTCAYCNILGHTQEKCRRRLREQSGNESALPQTQPLREGPTAP